MVTNAKEWSSVGFFAFLTIKEFSNHFKAILKQMFKSKLMGLKISLKKDSF